MASLYRGFRQQSETHHFSLTQFTASGCPPVLDFVVERRGQCIDLNRYVSAEINRTKPDVVIMGAYWSLYAGDGTWERMNIEQLKSTVVNVKRSGVSQVILIGHLPAYSVRQADLLLKRHPWESVSVRTYREFKPEARELNEKIRQVAQETGAAFIDPLDVMCNEQGCLIAEEGDPIRPFAYDYGHLTERGSAYVVARFFENRLINLPRLP